MKTVIPKITSPILERAFEKLDRRVESYPIEFYQPSPKQSVFHHSNEKIRLFIGSNQSGKTTAGATEMVWWVTGTHPFIKTPPPPLEVWVVSLDHQQQRDGSQKKILEFLPAPLIRRRPVIQRDIIDFIELTNGSKITFKSFEAETEKFAAAVLNAVWIDEEPPEEKYKEIYIRTLRHKSPIWITMTPVKGVTWTYHTYYRPYYENKTEGVNIVELEITDNPYIPVADQIKEMQRIYTVDELEARLRGKYTVLAGKMVFPQDKVQALLKRAEQGMRGRLFEKYGEPQLMADESGELEIWEPPLKNHSYVIGADVAQGLGETSAQTDYSVAVVLKVDPLKVVAMLRTNTSPPSDFFQDLNLLGYFYNTALIGVEDEGPGIVVNFLLNNGDESVDPYPNLYYREAFSEAERQVTKKIGWLTKKDTRPLMIMGIHRALMDNAIIIPSRIILGEMTTFIVDKNGKPQHQRGAYDDCLFGLGIGIQILESETQEGEVFSPSKERVPSWVYIPEFKSPKDHFDDVLSPKSETHWLTK